jgi:hypothetical protein
MKAITHRAKDAGDLVFLRPVGVVGAIATNLGASSTDRKLGLVVKFIIVHVRGENSCGRHHIAQLRTEIRAKCHKEVDPAGAVLQIIRGGATGSVILQILLSLWSVLS